MRIIHILQIRQLGTWPRKEIIFGHLSGCHGQEDSTWANLHRQETKPFTFNPITSTSNDLEEAHNRTNNLVWRDIYDSLIVCRGNVVYCHPIEYLTILIDGELSLARNFVSVNQFWCRTLMIKGV